MSDTINYGISTYAIGNVVYFRGEKLPPAPLRSGRHIVFIGDTVFVNGYEWKNNKWQRTLRALWHLIF